MNKKTTIITLICIVIIGLISGLIIRFWPVIKNTFTGSAYLTEEEGQELYNKGLSDGNKNKLELENKLKYYETLVDQVPVLESAIKDKNSRITALEKDLSIEREKSNSLLEQLNVTTTNYEKYKSLYDDSVSKITKLEHEINTYKTEIMTLKANLSNYQNKILEYEKTISKYDEYLDKFKNDNQVVVKFYYDNSLYSFMLVNKGTIPVITDPSSTPTKEFIGWYVNNEKVNISEYIVNTDTTFIAGINYFYNVKFNVDGVTTSQLVNGNGYAITPADPIKDGYLFDGWEIYGIIYNTDAYSITQDIEFTARFTKVHTVKFQLKDNIVNTISVKNNSYLEDYFPELDDHTRFNYWTYNGNKINLSSYVITSDITFIADFTNKYDVLFKYEENDFNSQIILDGSSPVVSTPVDTDRKKFIGWSLDKNSVVDPTMVTISEPTTFYAILNYYYNVQIFDGDNVLSSQFIKENNSVVFGDTPIKPNYEFDFYTLDGTNSVDISTLNITEDTNIFVHFTRLYNVIFTYEDSIVDTQTVRENEYANTVSESSTDYQKFKGWSLDGVNVINVSDIPITQDTEFKAVIEYYQNVKFKVNNEVVKDYFVLRGSFAFIEGNQFGDYKVTSWAVNDIAQTLNSYLINNDTVFIANNPVRNKFTLDFNSIGSTRYSVNNSSAVCMSNFQLKDLLNYDADFDSCDFTGYISLSSGITKISFNGYSRNNTVTFINSDKVYAISVSLYGGGFTLYDYSGSDSLKDCNLHIVLTPSNHSGIIF